MKTYYRRWSSQRERFNRSSREAALDMFVFQSLREIGEQTRPLATTLLSAG